MLRDLNDLSRAASELFIEIARNSIEDRNEFSIALAGGSTPRSLYSLLASEPHKSSIEWTKVRFFFGDERNVPPDSEDSNYAMALETLLGPLKIDPSQVIRWQTELGAEQAAALYQAELEKAGALDLVILGLGKDAHTASLFPHTEALHDGHSLAIANWVDKLDDYRLTMTFKAISGAANIVFLVSGEEKAEAVADVLEGEFRPDDFPAQFVIPERGDLFWLLDEPAASLLRHRENLLFRPAET